MSCDQALDKLSEKLYSRLLVQEEHGFQKGGHNVPPWPQELKKSLAWIGLNEKKIMTTKNVNHRWKALLCGIFSNTLLETAVTHSSLPSLLLPSPSLSLPSVCLSNTVSHLVIVIHEVQFKILFKPFRK